VIGRLGAWITSLILCLMLVPNLGADIRPSVKPLVPLLSFGGWITVSGLASPLMVNLDRLIIGSMLSIAAVTYYSVPFQIFNKLPMLPGAMANVLFPALSATARLHPARASKLFERASRYALLVMFPGVLILFCFAPEVLALFFGADIANHGYCAMRWLLIGVLANGLALIPYGLVQAANRPDLTAKFHVAEFPIYFTALFVLLPRFGIAGAAAAWTIRVTADSLALFTAAVMILPDTRTTVIYVIALTAAACGFIGSAAMMRSMDYRMLFTLAGLVSYIAVGWHWVLDDNDRQLVANGIIRITMKVAYLWVPI
jgi:O-antigen/teichoic acid export membrane protein